MRIASFSGRWPQQDDSSRCEHQKTWSGHETATPPPHPSPGLAVTSWSVFTGIKVKWRHIAAVLDEGRNPTRYFIPPFAKHHLLGCGASARSRQVTEAMDRIHYGSWSAEALGNVGELIPECSAPPPLGRVRVYSRPSSPPSWNKIFTTTTTAMCFCCLFFYSLGNNFPFFFFHSQDASFNFTQNKWSKANTASRGGWITQHHGVLLSCDVSEVAAVQTVLKHSSDLVKQTRTPISNELQAATPIISDSFSRNRCENWLKPPRRGTCSNTLLGKAASGICLNAELSDCVIWIVSLADWPPTKSVAKGFQAFQVLTETRAMETCIAETGGIK